MNEKYSNEELGTITSDYLCDICHKPIYVNKNHEICITGSCKLCTKIQILNYDATRAFYLQKQNDWKKSLQGFNMFSEKYFKQRLHDIRHNISFSSWTKGQIGSLKLIHVNSILVDCSSIIFGQNTNMQEFDDVFTRSYDAFSKLYYFENVESEDIKLIKNDIDEPIIYESKYGKIIKHEFLKEHGIVDPSIYGRDDTHQYEFITKQRKTKDFNDMRDFLACYTKYYDIVDQMIYFFETNPNISRLHKYPASAGDFASLIQFMSIMNVGEHGNCNANGLKKTYQKAIRLNKMKNDFENFKKNYCGNTYAPLLIYDGEKYYFDFETIYTHLLYIFSRNKKIDGTLYKCGFQTLQDEKDKSSALFEKTIRNDLRNKSFTTYPKEGNKIEIKIEGKTYEYDCISIHEKKKIILLIEAKFRDISPASLTVSNFIDNIILDKESGLLQFAKKHNKLLDVFKKHYKKILLEYDFTELSDYSIYSYIITKFTPMIDSYLSVELMSYRKFKINLNNNYLKLL